MSKLRLRFNKTGRIKYISHLDLMRTMRRAFLRAGVELRYSQGFNPHPYMSAALPLSVGCESVCELLDFEPDGSVPDGLANILNAGLPEGITVMKVYPSVRKFNEIAWLEVRGRLVYNAGVPENITDELLEYLDAAPRIIISKKTKSGLIELDVKPFITCAGFCKGADEHELIVSARLSAQNPSVSHDNLMSALSAVIKDRKPDFTSFRRIEVYDGTHNEFK